MRSASVFLLVMAACAPEPTQGTELPAPAQSVHAAPAAPEGSAATPVDPPVGAAQAEENDPRWHATLRAIAAGYAQWGRVEDEMRWAPWLCRMPMPATARLSDSGDDATHGRKLYTLYAKDPVAYGAPRSFMPAPEIASLAGLTQVVVKEAFRPVEVATDPGMGLGRDLLPAEKDGKRYMPGEPMGLYVIFKPKKPLAETDAGWVYGTIATDGKLVTSAGRVASCMGCHEDAKHERLFGTDPIKVPPGPGPDGRHQNPSNR